MNGEVYTQQEFLDKFKQKYPSYGNAVIQGLTTDDELFKKIIAKYPSYLEHIKPQGEIQAGIEPSKPVEPEYPERPEYEEPPAARAAGWQPPTKEPVKEPNRVSRILADAGYTEPEPTEPEIIEPEYEDPSARAAGWQPPEQKLNFELSKSEKENSMSMVKTFVNESFTKPFYSFLSASSGTTGGILQSLDQYTKFMEEKTGIPRGGLFEDLSEIYFKNAEIYKQKGIQPGQGIASDIAKVLYEGAGGAAIVIPSIMALGKWGLPLYSGAMGGAEAISEDKSVIGGITKGVIKGTALKFALGGTRYLPRGLGEVTGAGIFGGLSLQEEMQKPEGEIDWSGVFANALLGAALTMQGKRVSNKEFFGDISKNLSGDKSLLGKTARAKLNKDNVEAIKEVFKGRGVKVSPEIEKWVKAMPDNVSVGKIILTGKVPTNVKEKIKYSWNKAKRHSERLPEVIPQKGYLKSILPKDVQNVDINQNPQTGKYLLSVRDKSGIVKTKEYNTYEEAQAIAVPLAKEVAEAQKKHAGVEKIPLQESAKPPVALVETPKVEQTAVVEGKVPVDKEGNDLVDMDGVPMKVNTDGTITLYHRTTPESAETVRKTGNFISLENRNETFFSNKIEGQGEGYGDVVVAVKVKPSQVGISDAFHGGEVHVTVSNKLLSKENILPEIKGEMPATKVPVAEKQPWEMTSSEFEENYIIPYNLSSFPNIKGKTFKQLFQGGVKPGVKKELQKRMEGFREDEISQALTEGKTPYKGWEKDYPELTKPTKEVEPVELVIPKELESLVEEAKKYKSVEDWTKFDKSKEISKTLIGGRNLLPTGTDVNYLRKKEIFEKWGGDKSDVDIAKNFYIQATKEVEPETIPKELDLLAKEAKRVKSFNEFYYQEGALRKIYKPIIDKVDNISVSFESTCVDCEGGAEFVERQMDKAIEISKTGKWAKKIKDTWANRLKDYDTTLYLTDEYLIFQESAIENFYKLSIKPKTIIPPIENFYNQVTEITEKGIVKEPISGFGGRRVEVEVTKSKLYKYIRQNPSDISEAIFRSLNNVITGRPIGVKHFIPKKAYLKTRTAEKKLAVYNFLDNFGIRGDYESQDDYTKRILAKYPRLGKHTKKIKDYVNQIFKEGKDKALSDARREGFISPPVGKEGEVLPDYKRTTYPVRPEEPTISTVKEPSKARGAGKIRIPKKALEGEGFNALRAIFGAKVARRSESGAIVKDYGQIKGVTVGGKTILDIESGHTNYDILPPEAYKISTGEEKERSFDEILDEAHNEIDRFERGEISKTGKILKEKLSAKELFEAEEWGKSEEVRIKEAVTEVGGLDPEISESGKTVKFEVPGIGIKTVMRTKDIHYDDVAERIDKRLREHEIPEEQLELLNKKKELRQRIHAFVSVKGMTDTQLRDIIKKRTLYKNAEGEDVGYRSTTNKKITVEQLEKILKSVKAQRPKRIGYKRVITLKTENKIQSLKDNLTKQNSMTDEYFQNILQKEVHGKEPKYISKNLFITESEGKSIVDRMHDESEIINQNESFNRAIKKKPEIEEQVRLLTDKILNKKKRDPHSLESIRHYCQQSEIVTGSPIFTAYQELIDKHLEILNRHGKKWEEISNCTDDFKVISGDESSIERVREYIASKSHLKRKPKKPKNLTEGELILAKKIESILKDYEHKARTAKFFNYRFYDQPIPDYDRYKKEIDKAVDVYDSKGREALIEYLKTQDWGIIHSGYEPLQVAAPKIKTYKIPPGGLGKGHIKIRSDIEYHKQERNILQRLNSYMKQIDMLYELQPKIRAFIRLYDDNFDKFKNSNKVKNDVELFLKNVKRYNIQGGFFEKVLARLYSQAMRVIIMPSPVLSFRNLFQNAAFEHDKSILIDPRNKKLTNEDIKYLESYCLQTRQIIEEYFMIGEKPLPGLAFLTNIVNKVKIYPYSDLANRYWSFWAKKNQVDRALKKPKSITGFMKNAKFEDISELEQKRALGILARDGEDAASRYIARVHVDDIHFLYERAQRSPAEMSPLGRVMGNLMLFPRAYGEKLAKAASKVINKKASFSKRYRGLKILFSVIAGGMIAGEIYKKITGRTRNPYNPLQTLSYEPGGLAWGTVEIAGDIYSSMLHALMGDDRALNELTTAIPKAADMFIPFYAYSIRAIEASVDKKNLDRLALRKIRELIDNEYNVRGGAYEIERNALEKWQYFISGAGVDYKIQESKKQKKPEKFEPY